jgi:2-polyprenyl-6-methoxyphenol hydroxylase-like FAD-dependent oxidoreductase
LHRFGFQPTVVERSPGPRPGGQAVDLRGAGRDVVERMQLMPQVLAASLHERGFAYVDEHGRHVARMPVSMFAGEGIVAEVEILRGDLARILYAATCDTTEYLFNDAICSLDQDDEQVHVTFERSAPENFDLVLGADGVHSRVRALAFGDESQLLHPLGAYMAFFSLPQHLDTDGWFLLHNAPGGRVAALRPDTQQQAKAMLSFASGPLAYDRRDTAQQKALLAERFAGLGWEVPRMLEAMWSAPDFYFDVLAQVQLPTWSMGRVALVGDAGYSPSPLTGLGTTLALVGAYVLAGELSRADGDHRAAFVAYERALRGYVERSHKLPPGGVSGFLPRMRTAIWLRNQSMRLMTAWPLRNVLARTFETASSISLEDYTGTAETHPVGVLP